MMTQQRDIVVGVFRDHGQARQAIETLKDGGFRGQTIIPTGRRHQPSRQAGERAGAFLFGPFPTAFS